MLAGFYVAGAIAVVATIMTITRLNAVHALLYLTVSLLAVAVDFYLLGAPFIAALEVIVYAGAIMVLFIFVVMLLNLGRRAVELERSWLTTTKWLAPAILALILMLEFGYIAASGAALKYNVIVVTPVEVGMSLYGTYLIGLELASTLLLAGLIGAYHLGWLPARRSEIADAHFDARRTAVGGDFVRTGADRPHDKA
jgi:NADH-quinone oxidoreductase subunit J